MTRQILFVMDPIDTITPYKDTTLAMMLAAQERGWQIHYCQATQLEVRGDAAFVHSRQLAVEDDAQHWFRFLDDTQARLLTTFDAILMRKDPPFDMNFIYATYALELAERQGAMVVNRPQALRDFNEKYAITRFPQCTTASIISASVASIRQFLDEHQDIVVKPLDGMGGQGIFRLRQKDPNFNVILETLTEYGRTPIMAQRFLPDISTGDKRILVIDGKPLQHALARIPSQGETRGNLAAGGRGEVVPLNDRDRYIVHQVAPTLLEYGLLFVGLDVIGDSLTEVNVTSPTCVREIQRGSGENGAALLMEAIAQRWRHR